MKTRISLVFLIATIILVQAGTNLALAGKTTDPRLIVEAPSVSQQTGTAVLTVSSGIATQTGGANPLAGRALGLMKESFEGFLRRKGMFQGPPGQSVKVSPLASWAYSCRTGMPVCRQSLYDAQEIFASNARMDLNGKTTFPGVPPGTYYILVQGIANNQHLVWDLRVDLRAGPNSITLDHSNITPLDEDQTRAKATAGGTQPVADSRPCSVSNEPRATKAGLSNSSVSVIGMGYVYTYASTDRRTGAVVDSFTERGNFSNTRLYLLNKDADQILETAGVQPGLLGSRLAMLTFFDAGTQVENVPGLDLITSVFGQPGAAAEISKEARADFECAMKAIRSHTVAEVTTDGNARGVFPKVPAGDYYLFGRFYRVTKPVRAGGMIWNLAIDIKPGQNVVRLTVDNAALK